MAGNTPAEAVEAFAAPIRRATSCITRSVPLHDGHDRRGGWPPHTFTFPLGEESLRTDSGRLFFSMVHHYWVVKAEGDHGPWKVRTAAYYYNLDDANHEEIVAYHWHPDVPDEDPTPHLHIRTRSSRTGRTGSTKFPSGRVAIEDVIRLLIVEFGVRTLREDWRDLLGETKGAFEQWRTWG